MPNPDLQSCKQAGKHIADAIDQALQKDQTEPLQETKLQHSMQRIRLKTKKLEPTHSIRPARVMEWQLQEDEDLPVSILQIGPLRLAGLAPELNSVTGHQLRHAETEPFFLTACMVNGCAKYLPDEKSYERITYEAQNSRYMPGSAERIVSCLHPRNITGQSAKERTGEEGEKQ